MKEPVRKVSRLSMRLRLSKKGRGIRKMEARIEQVVIKLIIGESIVLLDKIVKEELDLATNKNQNK